jgi:hypothetical protein
MAKSTKMPAIAWLRVTEFIRGWLDYEYGSKVMVNGRRVVCLQHLDGVRDILRMETVDDMELSPDLPVELSLSAQRYSMLQAAMTLSPEAAERMYHLSSEELQGFVPIEVPRVRLTEEGLLRPWSGDAMLGGAQAKALLRLLREAFWEDVERFARRYAREHEGEKYAQEDMIVGFCQETKTSELHIEAIRREWQRRCKRAEGC